MGGGQPASSGGLYSRKMQMGKLLHKGNETKVVNAGRRTSSPRLLLQV